jgi:hypothetical protein
VFEGDDGGDHDDGDGDGGDGGKPDWLIISILTKQWNIYCLNVQEFEHVILESALENVVNKFRRHITIKVRDNDPKKWWTNLFSMKLGNDACTACQGNTSVES